MIICEKNNSRNKLQYAPSNEKLEHCSKVEKSLEGIIFCIDIANNHLHELPSFPPARFHTSCEFHPLRQPTKRNLKQKQPDDQLYDSTKTKTTQ